MKKNFQLFMFFLFTLLAGLLVYLGNDIISRFNELDDKVTKFEEELRSMRGALSVVQNFEGIIDKEGKGVVIDEEGKAKKANEIKPVEGFYCNSGGDQTLIVELGKNYQVKAWNIDSDKIKVFSRAMKPLAQGAFFIRGANVYATVTIDGNRESRKFQILKIDSQGYATELELSGQFLSYNSCIQEVQVAY